MTLPFKEKGGGVGSASQAEGIAQAKALKGDRVWRVQGIDGKHGSGDGTYPHRMPRGSAAHLLRGFNDCVLVAPLQSASRRPGAAAREDAL